jgi:TPR repeat protein
MSVALLHLGEIYGEGNGVHVDRKQAFRFYSQASETGLVSALQKMAHCYLNGIGTKKNEDEGYLVLAKLALYGNDEESWTLLQNATESDNPAAEFGMYVYYRGKQNLDVAYEWLEKAAGQGNGNALCGMALRCEAEGDAEQRRDYFRLAAEAGNAEAQLRYALLLEDWSDKSAPTNQEAFKWMSASADAGHSQALCYLGDFYLDGFGVAVDRQKAYDCFLKSAEMNDADGIERLGEYHAFGEVQNPSQAFYWFQRAAQLWHTKGLCNLGFCYLKGFGCQPDVVAGFQYITMAVESGDPIAMKMLKVAGLDVEKMSSGYRESLKVEASARKGNFSGAGFERLFSTAGSRIPPVPPNSEE